MHPSRIATTDQALSYLTDCTLATVCDLAMKKSASKSELKRQISMAQTAIDSMKRFNVDFKGTRAEDICSKHNGSVAAWAETFKSYLTPSTASDQEKQ
jgi:hypothetical protein